MIWIVLIIICQNLTFTNIHLRFISNPIVLEFCLGLLIHEYFKRFELGMLGAFLSLAIGILIYITSILVGYGDISEAIDTIQGKNSVERFFLWGLGRGMIVLGLIFLSISKRRSWIDVKSIYTFL